MIRVVHPGFFTHLGSRIQGSKSSIQFNRLLLGKNMCSVRRAGGVPAARDVPAGGGGQADEAAAAGGQAGQNEQVRGAGHRQGARHHRHQGVQIQGDHRG
jgi:hypothetical protein